MNKSIILQLEKELLNPDVRNNSEKIKELLSEDFIEYCSSGSIYRYKTGDTFENKESSTWEIVDISVHELSEGICLALYKLVKNGKKTLRSSIWKRFDSGWKLVFHQGTPENVNP